MKKIIISMLIFSCILIGISTSNIRIAQGEIISQTYIESANYVCTEIVTTDGEAWIAEGYTASIGEKVFIIYDRCDKSTLYDDEIMYICHFAKF